MTTPNYGKFNMNYSVLNFGSALLICWVLLLTQAKEKMAFFFQLHFWHQMLYNIQSSAAGDFGKR